MSAIDATKPTAGTALTADVRANFLAAKNEIDANTAAAAAALSAANAHSARVDNPHALTATQVGLGSVNNTADAAKPVSTAQAAADATVAANASAALSGHTVNVANPHAVTAAQVGLGSVDNTSDASKPVSTAQQAALNLKASLASPTFTGAVTLPGGQVVNGVTLTAAGSAANFLRADGTYGAPAGAGDMVLASTQTNTGAKTFNAGTLLLRNVANTISSLFTNAATVARTWTFPDKDGTVAMTSDITGTNTGINTGDNATNSQYSGLAATKQDTLVSGTNIKTINGNALPGAGNIVISGGSGLPTDGSGAMTGTLTRTRGTLTSNSPSDAGTETWNNGAVTFVSDTRTITDTASDALSLIFERIVGTVTRVWITKNGGYFNQLQSNGRFFVATKTSAGYSGFYLTDNNTMYLAVGNAPEAVNGSGTETVKFRYLTDLQPTQFAKGIGFGTSTPDNAVSVNIINAATALEVNNGTIGTRRDFVVRTLIATEQPIAMAQAAPTLASAATIAPTVGIAFVSGVVAINTITAPAPIAAGGGQITLIPTGLFTTTTAGNIALATTAVVSRALILTYDVTTGKWYPSY